MPGVPGVPAEGFEFFATYYYYRQTAVYEFYNRINSVQKQKKSRSLLPVHFLGAGAWGGIKWRLNVGKVNGVFQNDFFLLTSILFFYYKKWMAIGFILLFFSYFLRYSLRILSLIKMG